VNKAIKTFSYENLDNLVKRRITIRKI